MKPLFVSLGVAAAAVGLLVAACSQAAPAPTAAPAAPKAAAPTAAPAAAPTAAKVSEPTKAPAAAPQPTAVPAKKVDFPTKGKSLTFICPLAPGGAMDFLTRLLGSGLEKELGIPVEVQNKSGAGGQEGYTALVQAKPDGYTIGYGGIEAISSFILDPRRKAVFTRKDFAPLAMHTMEPAVIAVRSDSPWKDVKDLVDAAKAKPGEIRASVTGVLAVPHIASLMFENATGTKLRIGNSDSGSNQDAMLLGGHADVLFTTAGGAAPQVLSGDFRVLGVYDTEHYKGFSDVKTMKEQGYNLVIGASRPVMAPGATPKEIQDVLAAAIKKTMETPDQQKRAEDSGMYLRYMDPAQTAAVWEQIEGQMKPVIDGVLAAQK